MLNEATLIRVDDGETFEGNLSHWRDCFFSNPTQENIEAFCKQMGMKVEFINTHESSYSRLGW